MPRLILPVVTLSFVVAITAALSNQATAAIAVETPLTRDLLFGAGGEVSFSAMSVQARFEDFLD